MDSFNSPTTKPLYRGTQIVWYIIGLLEILLLFRFVLKFLAANSTAGFTKFVYSVTQIFVSPFVNVFKISYVEGSIFEWTTLLAMLVYFMIATGIIKIFLMSKTVSTPEAAIKMEEKEV
jgi:hypothetical protein